MGRPVTLFTGQWADLDSETVITKAKEMGYDGVELGCWGDHFEVDKADADYCKAKRELLAKHDMKCYAISSHLVGQGICDLIDERHQQILPEYVWGDGDPEGVRQRAAGGRKRRPARTAFVGDRFSREAFWSDTCAETFDTVPRESESESIGGR